MPSNDAGSRDYVTDKKTKIPVLLVHKFSFYSNATLSEMPFFSASTELYQYPYGAGEDPWQSLGLQGDQTNQSWIIIQEGLLLKLKLQYFGHLMWRSDSLEKTLMLGKTEGSRRGQQKIRWWDNNTNSMDVNLSKRWEIAEDRGAWGAIVHGVTKSQTQLSNWKTTTNDVLAQHAVMIDAPECGQIKILWALKLMHLVLCVRGHL